MSVGLCFQFPFRTTCLWHRKPHSDLCSGKVLTSASLDVNSCIPNILTTHVLKGDYGNLQEMEVSCLGKQDRLNKVQ